MGEHYHHGDLRRALLDALDAAIAADGPGAASTRALARKIGVVPSAVFRHFRDRRALLTAYAAEGFRDLASQVRAGHADGLRGVATAYLDFAFAKPGCFRTMFRADLLDPEDPDLITAQRDLADALGVSDPQIGTRIDDAALVTHAAIHGLACLAQETSFGAALPADLVERRAAIVTVLRRVNSV